MLIQRDEARNSYLQVADTEDLTTLQGRLRKARELAGLTTKALAAELTGEGIETSDAKVSRIENGIVEPDLPYIIAVARRGALSLDWVILGTGDKGTARDVIRRLRSELDQVEADYATSDVRSASVVAAETSKATVASERAQQVSDASSRRARSSGQGRRSS